MACTVDRATGGGEVWLGSAETFTKAGGSGRGLETLRSVTGTGGAEAEVRRTGESDWPMASAVAIDFAYAPASESPADPCPGTGDFGIEEGK